MTTPQVHPFRHGEARRTPVGYLTEDHPRLDRVQNSISWICGGIAAVAIIVIVLLTLFEVAARTFFDAPQGWSVALIEKYLMTASAFFGIVTAYRGGSHIAVVTFYERFRPATRKALLILAYIVVLIGMAAIGVAGLTAAAFSLMSGEGPVPGSSELIIPSWLWRSIVPASMFLGMVIVAIDLFRELTSPWDGPSTDYDPGDEVDAVLEELALADSNQAGSDNEDPNQKGDVR